MFPCPYCSEGGCMTDCAPDCPSRRRLPAGAQVCTDQACPMLTSLRYVPHPAGECKRALADALRAGQPREPK